MRILTGVSSGLRFTAAAFALSRSAVTTASRHHPPIAAFISLPTKSRIKMSASAAASKPSSNLSTSTGALSTSDRVKTTLEPCVILMKEIIRQHADKWVDRGGIFSLAQGVVYWNPPAAALEAIATAALSDSALHTYCPDEGLPELRSALVDKLSTENGLDNVEVIVTSGANQAYVNCVMTLLGEGDKCVVFSPYYFNHVMAIQMSRGEESLVVGPVVDDGAPDLHWLKSQLERDANIKAVTIVNPGNPTGVSLPRSYLQDAVALCKKFGVWLIMDNTYEHFDHSGANGCDVVPFWCSSEEHVMNIFSFSKAFALAGFRVGYVVISNSGPKGQDAYTQMLKVQDTIAICPARVSQIASLASIKVGREWVSEHVATLGGGRKAILDALSPLEKKMGGTGAMYVMAKLPEGMDDKDFANALVEQHGVAIIPGSFCGLPGWIRVCYSNLPPEKCLDAASRLSTGIKELCCGQ